jgi:hypothetical protein
MVAGTLAKVTQDQQAEQIARSITDPGQLASAMAMVAEALAKAGRCTGAIR